VLSTSLRTLPSGTDTTRAFREWVAEGCTPDALALDVGAGYDRNQVDATVQPLVACLVGVDPSDNIFSNPFLHERHHVALTEFARLENRRFDIVCAAWVLEHVSDPTEFFSACRGLLKPGGDLFIITPNLWHYFGLTAKASSAVGLEDRILAKLMGTDRKAAYHFPTAYRANSIRSINRFLDEAGFRCVEFRCCDTPRDYDYVVPPRLRWFPRLYSRVAYRLRAPTFMGRLMFRAS
jgi:SAM-dependent methyltransferase